nr:hypothetical protein [Tanacetum cinerariifolium]
MGQLAEEVHKQEAGKLPSYPDLNPKHKPGGPKHVNMVTSLRNGKTYSNDIKIPRAHDFSHDVEDFVTDDEIIAEDKKADNVKFDSELVNDLLKDFPKPPTQNPEATESPKVGEGGMSSTTTLYPAALEKSTSFEDWLKMVLIIRICGRLSSNSLPPNFKDPEALLISVVVGNVAIKKALLDLGASINILPASLVDNSLDHQRPPWSYTVEPLPANFDTATKPSLEVPPTLELKPLPSNLKYAFLDLKGISPSLCMHRIVTDLDVKPSRDAQRRLNPNMKDVVKKEVLKWLDSETKSGEKLTTRPVAGWRVCIDYRKLNNATSKDHFSLPFIDQIVEKLSGQKFYCFLDGYSEYNQIPIHPDDQAKTTFACPYVTFVCRRMQFEIFMDGFSIFGQSFERCLGQLESVLKRCIETNLVLSWEKSHFMVREGIVLGHVISEKGFEVDRAK